MKNGKNAAGHRLSNVATLLVRNRWLKPLVVSIGMALFLKLFVIEAVQVPTRSMERTILAGDFILVNKLPFTLRISGGQSYAQLVPFPFLRLDQSPVERGDVLVFEFPYATAGEEEESSVHFVKRCIGLPGDTVMIQHSRIFINGNELMLPSTRWEDQDPTSAGGNVSGRPQLFGPVVVPSLGDTIDLVNTEDRDWRTLIEREGHIVERSGMDWIIDGITTRQYVVERAYYFMVGDNLHNSYDSRSWGFVPEEFLRGEALIVYWSLDPYGPSGWGSGLDRVRWDRIGQLIR